MMIERGIKVDHTIIMRWLHQYSPEIEKKLPKNVEIRQVKYLSNIIEQDHRSIKRIVRSMLGFQSFSSASKTLKGIEAMNMVKKDKSII